METKYTIHIVDRKSVELVMLGALSFHEVRQLANDLLKALFSMDKPEELLNGKTKA